MNVLIHICQTWMSPKHQVLLETCLLGFFNLSRGIDFSHSNNILFHMIFYFLVSLLDTKVNGLVSCGVVFTPNSVISVKMESKKFGPQTILIWGLALVHAKLDFLWPPVQSACEEEEEATEEEDASKDYTE
jgi:hypothetical protein